jgi:hypothetical protein
MEQSELNGEETCDIMTSAHPAKKALSGALVGIGSSGVQDIGRGSS